MTLVVTGAVALLVFTAAAAAQAVTGFGMALVAVPLLTVVVGPVTAVVSTTVVSLVLAGWASYRERAHVDRPVAARLVLAALAGMPLGLLLLARVEERLLKAVIAVVLLVAVALLVARVRLPAGRSTQWASGALSGAMLTSTGMNGPPLVLTLQPTASSPHRLRGTLQATFCAQDLVAVAAFAVVGRVDAVAGVVALAGGAAAPVGWWVGDRVFRRLPQAAFRAAVLAMLTLTALVALVGAVS